MRCVRDPKVAFAACDMRIVLCQQGNEIAIAQAVSKVPANAILDDFTGESPTLANSVANTQLRHGGLQGRAAGHHAPPLKCTRMGAGLLDENVVEIQ